MKLQRKIAHASEALKVFVCSDWKFGVDSFVGLNDVLRPEDV